MNKYDEDQNRRDREDAETWGAVLTCGAWTVVAVCLMALYMVVR